MTIALQHHQPLFSSQSSNASQSISAIQIATGYTLTTRFLEHATAHDYSLCDFGSVWYTNGIIAIVNNARMLRDILKSYCT